MIFWSFGFLRMGTVGMVSQANGKEDFNEIVNIVSRNLLFVFIISIFLIIIQNYILYISLRVFELSDVTQELYKEYFNIRIYSAPGELTLYIITGLFVGLQKTKISSIAVVFFSILNIFLSIILVIKYDLNIKGVAYGTLFSALITSTIFLIYTFIYLGKITRLTLNFDEIFNISKLKNIFNINFNIFIRTILLTFSFLWFTFLGTNIGEEYVAANTILINLVFLSAFILDAYAFSTEGMVGYSLGKNNLSLFKKILKNSFILSSITGFVISIIYFLFNDFAVNLMSDIDEVKKLSSSFVIWLIILPFIASFCYQFDGVFIGASQTQDLRNAMIFSVFFYLVISIFLTKYYSNTGVWISLCLFMILRALSLFYYLKNIIRRFN